MYNYNLTGKIHPERVEFTIANEIPLQIQSDQFNIAGNFRLNIKNSDIFISYETEKIYTLEKTGELETTKNVIEDVVRAIVDAYCFVNSYAYEVEITSISSQDIGLEYQFGVRGEWNISKTSEQVNEEFTRIVNLFTCKENQTFRYVLADFRRAIKYPSMTASFCFRAIETIRIYCFEDQALLDDGQRRKRGWEVLRSCLGLKEADFDEISKYAKPNRHGVYPTITYDERERIMNFTRSVIERTISWLYS